MAKKKPDMTNLFAKTEPSEATQEEQEDKVRAVGIGLKESEWEKMEKIADELGMTRHALAMYALRDFMRRYDAGEIQTQTRPTLPDL